MQLRNLKLLGCFKAPKISFLFNWVLLDMFWEILTTILCRRLSSAGIWLLAKIRLRLGWILGWVFEVSRVTAINLYHWHIPRLILVSGLFGDLDGNRFNQGFQKNYHWMNLLKTFFECVIFLCSLKIYWFWQTKSLVLSFRKPELRSQSKLKPKFWPNFSPNFSPTWLKSFVVLWCCGLK